MDKFLIIDGTALVFRGFYAIPPLYLSNGTPTNAIFGFYTILFNLLLEEMPDYFVVCFDRPEETQRKKDFADYKAQRKKAPDDLYSQIRPIKQILKDGNLNLLELAGYEADDLIATLAIKNQANDLNTLIYSADLDLMQLVNDNIKILKPGTAKTGNQILTTQYIFEKYGLTPTQIQDYKGLRGDSSDNLPGVKGVGDKTATSLIQKYNSLENIYANIGSITGSLQQKLITYKDQAFMCKSLATLQTDCNIETNLHKFRIQKINFQKINQHLENLQMNKLNFKATKLKNKIEQVKTSDAQISLF